MQLRPSLLFQLSLHLRAVALLILCAVSFGLTAQEVSSVVYRDDSGMLRYQTDEEHNYIPDFSHAGYKNGEAPLPEVPTVLTIQAVDGDNTAHIQNALDQLAARTPDTNGYRGALLLEAGVYDVSGQLYIRESGMVLRGVGQGATAADNTIIRGLGNVPDKRNLIVAGSGSSAPSWSTPVPGTESVVTSPFVPNGSRSLEVSAAELYREGDNVIVYKPSTAAWLRTIGFGNTASDAPWRPGGEDIFYNRYITNVNIPEGKITLDAPIHDHLERSLAQAEVYTINTRNLRREIGIENLRIDVVTAGELTEDHVRTTILLNGVEDSWLKNVTALNFSYALVDMRTATRVTVTGCEALSPHSPVSGGRRYNFCVSSRSNNVLFTDNRASDGRHSFVSNGTSSVSGIVFTNSVSNRDLSPSEGHRRWSQGLLFDKLTFTNSNTVNLVGLYNRGDFGTGHGWASVNSVAWNVRTPPNRGMIIQKPPGRQNYAIGCHSNVTGNFRFAHPAGKVELTNRELAIPSLYEAQLEQRLRIGALTDAPARLSGSVSDDVVVKLEWLDIAANETGYEISMLTEDGLGDPIDTIAANSTSFTFMSGRIADVGVATFRVSALAANGPSPYSNPVTLEGAAAVREASADELQLFPNPVSDRLRIKSALPVRSAVIYGANGALITQQANGDDIDTRTWSAGLYYLKITTATGEALSTRFVKR